MPIDANKDGVGGSVCKSFPEKESVRRASVDLWAMTQMGRKGEYCLNRAMLFLRLGSVVVAGGLSYGCDSGVRTIDSYGEVLATVNGDDITTSQLRSRLAQLGLSDVRDDGNARQKLLEAMIDEQLLIQKARARNLDRKQETRDLLEIARRRVLVRAAIEDDFGGARVSDKDVRDFHRANPNLFEKRRIYKFHRFVISKERIESVVKARLDEAKTPERISALLRLYGLKYFRMTEVRSAESLPSRILDHAVSMEPGDILMFTEGGSSTVLLQLADSIHAPISLEAALSGIRKSLLDGRRSHRIAEMIDELRREARIEYSTNTGGMPRPTALADRQLATREPPLKKALQSEQITEER